MFTKVLLCTDLSPAMDNMLTCLGQLKSLGTEEVILAHIVYVANTPGLEDSLMRDAGPRLAEERKKLEEAGLKVQTEMFLGKPAYSLVDLADRHDVDLILVGSHGYGTLTSLVLGNVSERLLSLSGRPVLLSRIKTFRQGRERHIECGRIFSRVLFPTDFSDPAELAYNCLRVVIKTTGCPVTLVTVRSKKERSVLEQEHKIDASRLERLREDLEKLGSAEVNIETRTGDPGKKISEMARDHSLIIMGTHGRGFSKRLLMGSVAHKVAREAEIPILFMPAHCLCELGE